jgi:hypothetical protein
MNLDAVSFLSNGEKMGAWRRLEGKKESWARWKFVIPEGFPQDELAHLGEPFIRVNFSCRVEQDGLSSQTWPSPYAPIVTLSCYNPKTKSKAAPTSNTLQLIDRGRIKKGATTSIDYFIGGIEEGMEVNIVLKRPPETELVHPSIIVNKGSCWLTYIYRKGFPPDPPDLYEPNNTPQSAPLIEQEKVRCSIWDGKLTRPIDVDWYKIKFERHLQFEIRVEAIDKRSKMMPLIKLYNKEMRFLTSDKAKRSASVRWSGKGPFYLCVRNLKKTEGPKDHRYIIRIKKSK